MASSGEEGLRMIAHDLPDLIVRNHMLPDADGFAVCKKIRQDEATKAIFCRE